jgi:hypothetical protein
MRYLALLFLLVIVQPVWAAEKAFQIGGPTISIAATATTARGQFQTSAANPHARIYNSGTVLVFVACGDVNVTASATASMPVAGPGTAITASAVYVAASPRRRRLYVTPGIGGAQ